MQSQSAALKYIYTLLKYTERSDALGHLFGATLPIAPSDDLRVEGQSVPLSLSETKTNQHERKITFPSSPETLGNTLILLQWLREFKSKLISYPCLVIKKKSQLNKEKSSHTFSR